MSSTLVTGYDMTAPPAIMASVGQVAGGNMGTGSYAYIMTFVTPYGQTLPSPASAVLATSNGSASLTLPVGSSGEIIYRNLFRTTSGGSVFYFLAKVNDNTTVQYNDIAADSSLGAAYTLASAPGDSEEKIEGYLKLDRPLALSTTLVSTTAGVPTVLSTEKNYIVTANAGDLLTLPTAYASNIGTSVWVQNLSGVTVVVYPYVGQVLSTVYPFSNIPNTSFNVAAGSNYQFVQLGAAVWYVAPTPAPVSPFSSVVNDNTQTNLLALNGSNVPVYRTVASLGIPAELDGTYTPTFVITLGFTAFTISDSIYLQVGNVVSVQLCMNATMANGVNTVTVTLPVARSAVFPSQFTKVQGVICPNIPVLIGGAFQGITTSTNQINMFVYTAAVGTYGFTANFSYRLN